jgi:hypothetical protein
MAMIGSSYDDVDDNDDDCQGDDSTGSMFAKRSGSYPDGHPKSAYKDDGDMKLFKDD